MFERRPYFAYGSNLNATQMARRCPQAVPVGRARLVGWQLVMNRYGLATVVPADGSTVWGGLWLVTPNCERALDAYESIDSGLYVRSTLSAVRDDESSTEALVYLATESNPGRARAGYLAGIATGARSFGLPDDYVLELERC